MTRVIAVMGWIAAAILLVVGAVMAAGGLLLVVWGIVARSGSDAGGIAAGTSMFAGAIALGIGGLVLGVTLAYVLPNRPRAR